MGINDRCNYWSACMDRLTEREKWLMNETWFAAAYKKECPFSVWIDETESRLAIEAPSDTPVDCSTCSNRGKPFGLSQESNCDHCIHNLDTWKGDLYLPPEKGK